MEVFIVAESPAALISSVTYRKMTGRSVKKKKGGTLIQTEYNIEYIKSITVYTYFKNAPGLIMKGNFTSPKHYLSEILFEPHTAPNAWLNVCTSQRSNA